MAKKADAWKEYREASVVDYGAHGDHAKGLDECCTGSSYYFKYSKEIKIV